MPQYPLDSPRHPRPCRLTTRVGAVRDGCCAVRATAFLPPVSVGKAAADDLDLAVQADSQNIKAWTARGLAYERLGDKEKAAGSYAKALNINEKYEPAKAGFARVGGQVGHAYQTF